MISIRHIKSVLAKHGKFLLPKELSNAIRYQFPGLGSVTIKELRSIIAKHPKIFVVKKGKIGMIDVETNVDEDLNEQEEKDGVLIDAFLEKLADVFIRSNLQEPVHHFATLVLFDRSLNYHFPENKELSEISKRFNPDLVYVSGKHMEAYLEFLKKLDEYAIFQNVFKGVITLLEREGKEHLKRTYFKAFSICIEFRSHRYNYTQFGKKFNSTLSKLVNNYHTSHISTSPEIISKIVAELSGLKEGMVVFDPAVGIGSFFVELAHKYSIYNYKAIGNDINWGAVQLCKINLLINGIFQFSIKDGDIINDPLGEEEIADIAISNPPFNLSSVRHLFHQAPGTLPHESSFLFLVQMIRKTKATGRIIEVVNDAVLFSEASKSFREMLITGGLLERVISLPTGVFAPYTNVAASVIVLNKKQGVGKSVFFVDARKVINVTIKNRVVTISDEQLEVFLNDSTLNFEPINNSEFQSLMPIASVKPDIIAKNAFNLLPIKYCDTTLGQIAKAKEEGIPFIKLSEILKVAPTDRTKHWDENYPTIKILDLIKDGGTLHSSQLKNPSTITGSPFTGRILSDSAILVARVGRELKPTFIVMEPGQSVVIHSNIIAFQVASDSIVPDYLIGQLNSDMVREQINASRISSSIPVINREIILNVEIPLLTVTEQIDWVAKNRRKEAEKEELASFIKSIPLIESADDLKKEIERFAKKQFNSKSAEFKRYFEYDKFPFTQSDNINFIKAKKAKNSKVTLISLENDEYGTFGALEIADESPIDFKKVQTINEYAAFLMKIYDFLTKSSINRQLDAFAHTSRNFFFKLQGDLDALLNSKNTEFQKILDNTIVESDTVIEHYIRKGTKKREDFLLRNTLRGIVKQTAAQYEFYDRIHRLYSEIKNAQFSHFEIGQLVQSLQNKYGGQLIIKDAPLKKKIFGKHALVEHALCDLVDNAISYSPDKICSITAIEQPNAIYLILMNKVGELIHEDRYKKLGTEWIKDNSGTEDKVSSGLYYAFQQIRESLGEASLFDYEHYKTQKLFTVIIKLRKNE